MKGTRGNNHTRNSGISTGNHHPSGSQTIYQKYDYVVVYEPLKSDHISIYKLVDAVTRESKSVKATLYQQTEHPEFFNPGGTYTIQAHDILTQINITNTTGRKNKNSRIMINRTDFVKIKKQAQALTSQRKLHRQVKGESESESSSEEENESEGKSSSRKVVRLVGKKSASKLKKEENDKMEVQDQQTRRSSRRLIGKSREEQQTEGSGVKREMKKQKLDQKKEKGTKEEEFEEKKPKTQQRGKYVKGKQNTRISKVETYNFYESKEDNILDEQTVRNANKNLIRAALTKNHELLKKLLNSKGTISTLFEQRCFSSTQQNDAFSIILKNKDKKALDQFLDAYEGKNSGLQYTSIPQAQLSADEPLNALQYRVSSRIQPEGNRSLLKDTLLDQQTEAVRMKLSLQNCLWENIDIKMLDILRDRIPDFGDIVNSKAITAILSGNLRFSQYLVENNNEMFSDIHILALKANKVEEVENVSRRQARRKAISNNQVSPVHLAAINVHTDVFKAFIDKAGGYDIHDENQATPLHYASASETPNNLKYLIQAGASLNSSDKNKITPLMVAANAARYKNVEVLLEAGDLTMVKAADKDGDTALHVAVMGQSIQCVKLIVEKGEADVNARNKEGITPLMQAAQVGNTEIIEYLLEKGAKILTKDKQKRNALMYAVIEGHLKAVSTLLLKGADFTIQDLSGNTVLHYAAAYGYYEIQDLLIDAGAKINVTNSTNLTPFLVGLFKNQNECTSRLLSHKQVNFDIKDSKGRTIISQLIQHLNQKSLDLLTKLIQEKKVDLSLQDSEGKTALSQLCELRIEDLLATIPNYNSLSDSEKQNLQKEKLKLIEETAKLLINNGIPLNTQDINGDSPLYVALKCQNIKLAQILIHRNDIDLDSQVSNGKNILHSLATLITSVEGIDLVKVTIDKIGEKLKELIKNRDNHGYTPFLRFISSFAQTARKIYKEILTEIQLQSNYSMDSYNQTERKFHQVLDDFIVILNQLVKAGADVTEEIEANNNQEQGNALHFLCSDFPHPLLLNFILQNNSTNINQVNQDGKTPLLLFIENNEESEENELLNPLETLSLLLKYQADPNLQDYYHNYALFEAIKHKQFKFLTELINSKADINISDKHGNTLLILSIKHNSYSNAKKLIQLGCSIHAKDQLGRTALHYSVSSCSEDVESSTELVKLLLSHGADVNATDQLQRTPLHYAFVSISNPYISSYIDPAEAIYSLINVEGCNVDFSDVYGKTPLHYTAQRGSYLSAIYLLKKGAQLDQKDKIGNTPLAISLMCGHCNFSIFLIDKGANINGKVNVKFDQFKSQEQNIPHSNNELTRLEEGVYSMYRVALKHGWQNVAHLMLQYGLDPKTTLLEALSEGKLDIFHSLQANQTDRELFLKVNAEGQTFLHLLIHHSPGSQSKMKEEILQKLVQIGVDLDKQDNTGKTALHYGVEQRAYSFVNILLEAGANPNIQDNEGKTPFVILLLQKATWAELRDFINRSRIKVNVQQKFSIQIQLDKQIQTTPLVYLVSEGSNNFDIYNLLLQNGASVNEKDEYGYTPLIYAVRSNSSELLKFFMGQSGLDKQQQIDKSGKNPIHHVINPLDYGSYENIEFLELLAQHFDINQQDNNGNTPIYYASLQDSGVMRDRLIELGAEEIKKKGIKRAATSIVSTIEFADEEYDYEEDAEEYLKSHNAHSMESEEEYSLPETPSSLTIIKDPQCHWHLYAILIGIEPILGDYTVDVYIKLAGYYCSITSKYLLCQLSGRYNETAKSTEKYYETLAELVNEFSEIFFVSTGNKWGTLESLTTPNSGKYVYYSPILKKKKEFAQGIHERTEDMPKSKLDQHSKQFVDIFTDIKLYQDLMYTYDIDQDVLPLSSLEKRELSEARGLLMEIIEALDEIKEEKNTLGDRVNIQNIILLKEAVLDRTSRFYTLTPRRSFRKNPFAALLNEQDVFDQNKIINSFFDIQVAIRIILGALQQCTKVNPYDYVISCLNTKILTLPSDHPEYQLITQYVKSGYRNYFEGFIHNIFAVERRGEAERMATHKHLKNKKLLWYGPKVSSIVSILNQGLNPDMEGYCGRGIYLSDVFYMSLGYGSVYTYKTHYDMLGDVNYKFMLCCEVALGDMLELTQPKYITSLNQPYKSVKAAGRNGPNPQQNIYLPNGTAVPVGKVDIIRYHGNVPDANFNEYLVFDPSQVRIRYLIQLKETNS